jgi:hypothetical protein
MYRNRRTNIMIVNSDENLDLLPRMVDIIKAEVVEIVTSYDGKVWVNVDGICMLRVKHTGNVKIDIEMKVEGRHGNTEAKDQL